VGADKIYSAVAKHMGQIVGYLLSDELDAAGYTKIGIYLKFGQRQCNIDFVDRWGHGGPHIDFQPPTVGGIKYGRLFLEGLLEGLASD
jgi:hypothetical protein